MTFDDFTNKMLIDKHTKPTLGPTCFAIDGPDQLEKVFGSSSWGETSLSESGPHGSWRSVENNCLAGLPVFTSINCLGYHDIAS